MDYRRLGRSGLKVSSLALGTLNFGEQTGRDESFRVIDAALDRGINFVDCADSYAGGRSESVVGQALARDGKRSKVILSSKVFYPVGPGLNDRGNSQRHIIAACEDSLRRLRTDYLDLYFLHRTDWSLPQEETLAALTRLVDRGLVRSIGCSTHPPWRTVEALWLAEKHGYPKFVCEQPPYNLLDRRLELEIGPMCQAYDLGLAVWSPLAQGVLAGRYDRPEAAPETSRARYKKIYGDRVTAAGAAAAASLADYAKARGWSTAQAAVAWVINQPGVSTAIIGPRNLDQLTDLIPASDITLDQTDIDFCDSLVPPGDWLSDHFNTAGWSPPPDRPDRKIG